MWECHNNVLRAHASAVREFRRLVPNGKIGMNLAIQWAEPRTDSEEDRVRTCCFACAQTIGIIQMCSEDPSAALTHACAGDRLLQNGTWVSNPPSFAMLQCRTAVLAGEKLLGLYLTFKVLMMGRRV